MKKILCLALALAAAIGSSFAVVHTDLRLSVYEATLRPGGTGYLRAGVQTRFTTSDDVKKAVKISKKSVVWTSSDKSVVTVRWVKGRHGKMVRVRAHQPGTAVLTATVAGTKAVCRVTVDANPQGEKE